MGGALVTAGGVDEPRTASDGGAAGPSSLIPEDAQAWADRLAGFAATMASSGVPLAALSAQNEPNYYTTSWDTCVYSSTDLAAFIGNDLGPALAARGLSIAVVTSRIPAPNAAAATLQPATARR